MTSLDNKYGDTIVGLCSRKFFPMFSLKQRFKGGNAVSPWGNISPLG